MPLKAARLAVRVIQMLSEAERASRLSFADVIKRLSEEPQGSPLFISKNRDRVERFVVVHGQIFLNQIKAFPKQVRRARSSARPGAWGPPCRAGWRACFGCVCCAVLFSACGQFEAACCCLHPLNRPAPPMLRPLSCCPQSVQRSPFVSGLKAAMEARRHSKLYYSKKGFSRALRVAGVNRNPMKVRSRRP